ncbi:Mitochondrial substrate/solute carrier [Dillenia turbinata]|uniref:Mitochondrial substrate/solute carrier n=1 Tax=Dillenia turbinata TaxID=194707 RepID=A0AAN8V3V5_9MAGN
MSQMTSPWQWENGTAGDFAGVANVACMHPLDVVRPRFQANDCRLSSLPSYRNTIHALLTVARSDGLRELYAGFGPAVIGSTVSWSLYFFLFVFCFHSGKSVLLGMKFYSQARRFLCVATQKLMLRQLKLFNISANGVELD